MACCRAACGCRRRTCPRSCASCSRRASSIPQFQGQVKEKLTSRDALKLIAQVVKDPLEVWLNAHVEYGKKIAELAIAQALTRMKSAQKVEKKKGSGVAVLPGKLTDCESDDMTRSEVFLVEGDSAGGSAKLARDKQYQAILPLRGKVLNTFEVDRDRLFANNEIHDIAVAIGVDPHDARRRRPTSRACATARSSSWPTPTSTAATSRCCCSRSSSATSRR